MPADPMRRLLWTHSGPSHVGERANDTLHSFVTCSCATGQTRRHVIVVPVRQSPQASIWMAWANVNVITRYPWSIGRLPYEAPVCYHQNSNVRFHCQQYHAPSKHASKYAAREHSLLPGMLPKLGQVIVSIAVCRAREGETMRQLIAQCRHGERGRTIGRPSWAVHVASQKGIYDTDIPNML
jgi:hypothetical protein